jgi:SAM-dependent methyltransferase
MTEPSPGSWRERGMLFDVAAHDYLLGRPGYPQRVFDVLEQRGELRAGSSVLEIGPGTGQATLPLLALQARVTAVEPGSDLAATLRARAAGGALDVIVSRFEDVDLPPASFDLVVSATAFHWVDPTMGIAKCANLLRPGGWLALWWTIWGDPDREDMFHDRLVPLLAAKAPHLLEEGQAGGYHASSKEERTAEFEQTKAFDPVEQHVINWTGHHDAAQARALFASFSPWLALPPGLRQELLDELESLVLHEFDNYIERPYQTVLYAARRAGER